MQDELMTFTKPSYSNSIFIDNVHASDDKQLYETLSNIGLLYKYGRLQSNPNTLHVWYYSMNAVVKLLDVTNGVITVNTHEYHLHKAKERSDDNGGNKDLRLDQMYSLCNYYIGFNKWTTEVIKVNELSRNLENVDGKVKYISSVVAIIKLTFIDFKDTVVFGRGKSKYKGKDATRVLLMSKKLAITCAMKQIFKKIGIALMVNQENTTVSIQSIPVCLGISTVEKEEEGIHELEVEDVDEDDTSNIDDDLKELLDLLD